MKNKYSISTCSSSIFVTSELPFVANPYYMATSASGQAAKLHKTTMPNPIHRTASYKKQNFPKCEIALEPVYVGIGLGIREDLLEHLIKNHM